MLPTSGTLDVRLMGCQDLLEHVPGRSKAASVPLPGWSPSETRSSFISRANRNRGVSSRNLTKSEELSSELVCAPAGMNEKWVVNNRVLNVQSIMICGRSSDEISAVLKLDNTVVGQTSWKPVSNQSWDQKFTLELDRVKHTHTHTRCSVDTVMFALHFALHFVHIFCGSVSWAGDLCLLAWLAFALCCQVSPVGGLPGQPASRHVSVPGATGDAVCRGTSTTTTNISVCLILFTVLSKDTSASVNDFLHF